MTRDNCIANKSGMLACRLAAKMIGDILIDNPDLTELSIACRNGPGDSVIGGPLAQLDAFQRYCKSRRIQTKLINVANVFQTTAMYPIVEPLHALSKSIRFSRLTIPIVSDVHGRLFCNTDFTSDYFANHATPSAIY